MLLSFERQNIGACKLRHIPINRIRGSLLNHIIRQIFEPKKIMLYFVFAFIPAILFYALSLVGLHQALGFTPMQVLRDLAQQTEVHSFLGFLSNIGVWFWISSLAVAYFSAIYLHSGKHRRLLILMGMLASILAVDDFFLIHDRYVNQYICYFFYVVVALALLAFHFKDIVEIDGFAFLVAGGLLAGSIATDVIQGYLPFGYEVTQVFEEGCKFIGAASWLYFTCTAASYGCKRVEK
ncbi:oxidase [Aliivibrio sp. SR45-2]|uniref:Membrane protein n=2 Tax=Aliivibrio TaxID=511678 RepID=B6EGM4_ALISL|nr:hypothetical protein [Aliivibrio salmonicida]MBB1314584.1 oxidase [Aliivibrio sp. SR45-2]OEF10950.1 oxidase [Aliivibrio logei 5S-186]CAQ79604.1 membrane protein [Aliivibrio salmonicida LFI1238]